MGCFSWGVAVWLKEIECCLARWAVGSEFPEWDPKTPKQVWQAHWERGLV